MRRKIKAMENAGPSEEELRRLVGKYPPPQQWYDEDDSAMPEQGPECLDEDTMNAIDEAEAQLDRGEGIPADEAFQRLRERYLRK